jgi:hypothetical protein
MFERFSRSWALIKASAGVLRQDKELLIFPLLSSIAALLVLASFAVPLVFTISASPEMFKEGSKSLPPMFYVGAFLFYLTQYFVMFFFNAALVGAAMIRLNGGDPTVSDGLRIAGNKFMQILGYAAIAATVGMILRAIEERAGIIGKWVAGLLGMAWTVASFLTVPVLVSRDVGPIDAVKESAVLLKRTWGENLIGNGGVGLVFGLLFFVLVVLAVVVAIPVISTKSLFAIITYGVVVFAAFVFLGLIQSALQGVYSAALYRYAAEGQAGGEFSSTVLADAFRHKTAK